MVDKSAIDPRLMPGYQEGYRNGIEDGSRVAREIAIEAYIKSVRPVQIDCPQRHCPITKQVREQVRAQVITEIRNRLRNPKFHDIRQLEFGFHRKIEVYISTEHIDSILEECEVEE